MKTAAIIAEYNPMHSGHVYHIEQTRAAGATHIVAVLSGDIVQRAEPAIFSKFERARIAADCGADLVLELPAVFAAAGAERFAWGALSLIGALRCVDLLSFGCECGDLALLQRAAAAVVDPAVEAGTKRLYEAGDSYPKARMRALAERDAALGDLLRTPNNTLAIDYLKAIAALRLAVEPLAVRRVGASHDSADAFGASASASLIRQRILAGQPFAAYVPEPVADTVARLDAAGRISGGFSAVERGVLMRLRGMSQDEFCALPDCADGLGNRLYRAARRAATLEALYEGAKTRRYTMSRVRRAVCCALLGIGTADYACAVPYARVLAIGPRGPEVLRAMKQRAAIPVSDSLKKLMANDDISARFGLIEQRATDLFNLTTQAVVPAGEDFTRKLVVNAK